LALLYVLIGVAFGEDPNNPANREIEAKLKEWAKMYTDSGRDVYVAIQRSGKTIEFITPSATLFSGLKSYTNYLETHDVLNAVYDMVGLEDSKKYDNVHYLFFGHSHHLTRIWLLIRKRWSRCENWKLVFRTVVGTYLYAPSDPQFWVWSPWLFIPGEVLKIVRYWSQGKV
jgi:hypothetical protein